MKYTSTLMLSTLPVLICLFSAGCAEPRYTTSPYHPGPVAGTAVGAGVGLAVGESAGFVVGAGEGLVGGVAAPFDTTTHVVRHWRTEVTADGRTIQVPVDILVDSKGRPIGMAPPRAAPVVVPVAPQPAASIVVPQAAPVAPAPAAPATPAAEMPAVPVTP